MKITNMSKVGQTEKVSVICPECLFKNIYFVGKGLKYTTQRMCHECGAVIVFDIDEDSKAGSTFFSDDTILLDYLRSR